MNEQSGEQNPESRPRGSRVWTVLFWIALLLPMVLSLASFAVGKVSKDTGVALGFMAFFGGGITAIYCGTWLALRLFKGTAARVVGALVLMLVVGVVNVVMSVAGCTGNVDFR